MDIILNKVAIWRARNNENFTKRPAPLGTRYREDSSPIYKNAEKPIIRYAKDYTIQKVKYSLFLRTFCEDEKAVEKALDAVAKKLDKTYVLESTYNADFSNFTYTDFIFDEATKEVK